MILTNPLVRFHRILLLSSLVFLPAVGHASDSVVISTGKERGSYHYIGQRLKAELIIEYGQLSETRPSRGSLHNLALLDDPESPVNVALAQADALELYLADHPAFAEQVIVFGDLGLECVMIMTSLDGPQNAADLKTGRGRISIDDPSSGAAVTWRSMNELDPGFGATVADSIPTMEALLQLAIGGSFTDLRAVMVVGRPRRASPPIELALAKPDRYRFLPIREKDLASGTLPAGRQAYSFEKIHLGGKRRKDGVTLETLCTRGMILGSKQKLNYDLRSRLSTLMVEAGERIVGQDE